MTPTHRIGWAVLATALLVVACAEDPRPTPPSETTPPQAGASELAHGPSDEAFVGVVVAAQRADLAARADGLVTRITARLGTRVDEGALIAELDASELHARRTSVEAALDAARARERVARARSTSSATSLERYRSSADIVSAQDLAAVETEHEIAVGELAEAEAEVRRLIAELRSADDLVEQHRVRAPFAGIVASRHLDPGNWVAAGEPILTLASTSLLVRTAIPESWACHVEPGTEVAIMDPGALDRQIGRARIEHLADEIDPSSGRVLAEGELTTPADGLRAGQAVRVVPTGAADCTSYRGVS